MDNQRSTVASAPPALAPYLGDDRTTQWFASVVGHLNAFPLLSGTVTSVLGYAAQLHVGRARSSSRVAELASWARSMTALTLIHIGLGGGDGASNVHLTFHGALADGTRAAITCIVGEQEADLLAAVVPVVEGQTFPVQLLLQLVRSPAESGAVSR